MFDIGFFELIIIMIVALLVVGPERLPGIARKAGLWFGKGRRFVQSVKRDIDRELAAEELRRVLKEQADSSGVHEIVEETRGTLKRAEGELEQAKSDYALNAMSDGPEDQGDSPPQQADADASPAGPEGGGPSKNDQER